MCSQNVANKYRVISILTSHQYCNILTAHFAFPSVGDCYFSVDLYFVSNISSQVSLTYFHGHHDEDTRNIKRIYRL